MFGIQLTHSMYLSYNYDKVSYLYILKFRDFSRYESIGNEHHLRSRLDECIIVRMDRSQYSDELTVIVSKDRRNYGTREHNIEWSGNICFRGRSAKPNEAAGCGEVCDFWTYQLNNRVRYTKQQGFFHTGVIIFNNNKRAWKFKRTLNNMCFYRAAIWIRLQLQYLMLNMKHYKPMPWNHLLEIGINNKYNLCLNKHVPIVLNWSDK